MKLQYRQPLGDGVAGDGALLEQALESGRKRKDAYYAGRLAAGSRPPWVYRQMALAAREKGGVLPYDDLRQFLAEETLNDFLADALHVGLLSQTKHFPYHYQIPIPSFGKYLRALPMEPPQAWETSFGQDGLPSKSHLLTPMSTGSEAT